MSKPTFVDGKIRVGEVNSLSDIDAEIAKLQALKATKVAELEAKLPEFRAELEKYCLQKYGVSLHKIALARDPNAPAKAASSKGAFKPAWYWYVDHKNIGDWRYVENVTRWTAHLDFKTLPTSNNPKGQKPTELPTT